MGFRERLAEYIRRHPIITAVVSTILIRIPEWFSSIWSLYSSEPFIQFMANKGVKLPHLPWSWFPSAVGYVMLAYVVIETWRKERLTVGEKHLAALMQHGGPPAPSMTMAEREARQAKVEAEIARDKALAQVK